MRRRLLTWTLGLAAALACSSPAAAVTLRSGTLEARVGEQPFTLEFVDRSDGDRLRTLSRSGPYGPLGYSFDLRIPVVNNAYLGYYVAAEAKTV